MSIRLHARVKMRLPVRIRWMGSRGQEAEVCETKNVSRGGLLLACREEHNEGFPLWVSFPFDRNAPEKQPEVLARVLRCRSINGIGGGPVEMAVHFEGMSPGTSAAATVTVGRANVASPPPAISATVSVTPPPVPEMQIVHTNGSLRSLVVPIRVRPENIPWFEEAATFEVSEEKLKFLSHREFLPGDAVQVTFVGRSERPWPGAGEAAAEIVDVQYMPKEAAMAVTVKRLKR
jgi:hypothetical protein